MMLKVVKTYLAEALILLSIIVSGKSFIDSYGTQIYIKNEMQQITTLAEYAVELTVETLSTMNQSTRHYDRFAQKQFTFEDTLQTLEEAHTLSAPLKNELNKFLSYVSNYMQLATMLKTSYRVVTQTNFQSDKLSIQEQYTVAKLIALVASYQNATRESTLNEIETNLAEPFFTSNSIFTNDYRWKMFTLHINFITQNTVKAEGFLSPIRDTQLNLALTQSLNELNDHLLQNYWKVSWRGLAFVVSLFMLFITVMYRQSRQLQKANIKAMQAAETKSQFLANMSHEIRTPMNGIMGLTDILLNTDLTGHQKDYLDKIRFSAKSLTTIINDILDFSKIESEKLEIEYIPFNMAHLLDNVKTMVARSASDKGIEFIIEIDPVLSDSYLSDPVRLAQILMNLTSNAIKFTAEGHVLLRVTKENAPSGADNNSHNLLISVEDTGIGLSEDQQQKLFSRFTQAQSSTTRKYGGTGLGLTICKMLTELMGGEISVSSEVDKGSTFSVRLPMSPANVSSSIEDTPLAGQSLLIVEDNPITLEITAKMGEMLNLNVKQAANAKSALDLLEAESFDYLLVDWKLPDLTGQDFIKAIKNKLGDSASILIFTGFDADYLDADLAFPVLTKPVLKQDLYKALKKLDLDASTPDDRAESFPAASTAVSSPATQAQSDTPDVESGEQVIPDYSHLKVLLAEDNSINILVAKTILESLGITPTIAMNGLEAVECVKAHPDYDLVLMDVQMPEMDGMEATRQIREKLNIINLPIVALTANVMAEEVEQYKKIGMNGHLGKPYDSEQLKGIIEQMTSNKKK
jgi:signal transduction histidine kinase/DNA-binding response OmpR family regulator